MFLSTLAAYDLGYIDLLDLAARLRTTINNLEKLERYRGHFLNWYDTRTLEPLPPRYVSTVDSGNLAASFIILKQGCLAIPSAPVLHWRRWRGLHDTLAMLVEGITELDHGELHEAIAPLIDTLAGLQRQVLGMKDNPSAWTQMLAKLSSETWPEVDRQLISLVETYGHEMDSERLGNLRLYSQRAHHHLYGMQREVDVLFPWVASFAKPPLSLTNGADADSFRTAWERLQETLPSNLQVEEITAGCNAGEQILRDLRKYLTERDSGDPDPQISNVLTFWEEFVCKWCV
jgi:cyclic beta-1,2-glucan synthetase